jgi:hypothetical protein
VIKTTKFSPEIKDELLKGIESGDLQAIHDVLDALEDVDNPNLVRVEFKKSTLAFLKEVQKDIGPSGAFDLSGIVALCIDGMIKSYHAEKARKQQAMADQIQAAKEAGANGQTKPHVVMKYGLPGAVK